MVDVNKLKNKARHEEQRQNWSTAVELYLKALRVSERDPDMVTDLSLYNRIGDIHLRVGDQKAAIEFYERAIDGYAEQDLHSSAIALCNKILRIEPARISVFRRLGALHAATGLIAEARVNYFRFASAVREAGDVERGLAALEECVERTGDQETCRRLADVLIETFGMTSARARIAGLEPRLIARGTDTLALLEIIDDLKTEAPAEETSEELRLQETVGLTVSAPREEVVPPAVAVSGPPIDLEVSEPPAIESPLPPTVSRIGVAEECERRIGSGGRPRAGRASVERAEPPGAGSSSARLAVWGGERSEVAAIAPSDGWASPAVAQPADEPCERPTPSIFVRAHMSLATDLTAERPERPVHRAGSRRPAGPLAELVEEALRRPASAGSVVVPMPELAELEADRAVGRAKAEIARERLERPSAPGPLLASGLPPDAPETASAVVVNLEDLLEEARPGLSTNGRPPTITVDVPLPETEAPPTEPVPTSPEPDASELRLHARPEPAESALPPDLRSSVALPFEAAERPVSHLFDLPVVSWCDEPAETSAALPVTPGPCARPTIEGSEVGPFPDPEEIAAELEARASGSREPGPEESVSEPEIEESVPGLFDRPEIEDPPVADDVPWVIPVSGGTKLVERLSGGGVEEPKGTDRPTEPRAGPDHEFREFVASAPSDLLMHAREELESRGELGKALLVVDRLLELDETVDELLEARQSLLRRLNREDVPNGEDGGAAVTRAPGNEDNEEEDTRERESEMILEPMSQSFFDEAGGHLGLSPSGHPSDALGSGDPATGPIPYAGVAGGREGAADFEQLLGQLKQELADTVTASDSQTRTELGASLKQMGLLDDAIRELQAAVREPHALPQAFELLGEAFIEKGEPRVAARLLSEALEVNNRSDRELLGVLYQLGVAYEQVNERSRALDCFERIFGVDIDYRDVKDRILACSS